MDLLTCSQLPTPSLLLSLAGVTLYLVGILAIAELLNRRGKLNPELTRKIVHIGSGNVILFAWLLGIPREIGIAAAVIAGAIALLSNFVAILPSVTSVGRHSYGTFFYALSMGLLIGWFWTIDQPYFAVLGIMIMAWGDGLAAVIGSRWGRHGYKILGNKKTIEGTATMFMVSAAIAMLLLLNLPLSPWQLATVAFVVAALATALESIAQLGLDNLLVPTGSAAIAFILSGYFN